MAYETRLPTFTSIRAPFQNVGHDLVYDYILKLSIHL